jgi:hypothetical protein
MEPIQLPSNEEIRAAHCEGEEAVIALFHRTIGKLALGFRRWKIGYPRTATTVASRLPVMV